MVLLFFIFAFDCVLLETLLLFVCLFVFSDRDGVKK